MHPRKVSAPRQDASTVDDFGSEERILEEIIVPDDRFTPPAETFPLESRGAGPAQRTAVLEFQEPAIRTASRTPIPGAVPSTRLNARRSILRSIRAVGVLAVSITLAMLGGAVVRTRPDVSVLSNYLEVVRARASALRELLPQVDILRDAQPTVVPDSAVAASTSGATDTPPPTVVSTAVAAERPPNVHVAPASPRPLPKTISRSPIRASTPSPRPPASSSLRGAAAPPPTAPLRPTIQRTEEPPRPAPAFSASASSPAVPTVSSAGPVPALNPVPLTAVSSAAAPSPSPAAVPAPSPATAPAVPSAPSAIPAGGLTAETRAVALALNRYQDAFSALDANAAHAVWPSVDVKALAKAFEQLEEQTFDLEGCDITVTGARAEADCAGNARYVRKVGNRTLRVEPRRWHFTLRQANDQWLIDAVNAR